MQRLLAAILLLSLAAGADPTLHARADQTSGTVTAYAKDRSVTVKAKDASRTFRISDTTNVVGKPAPGATVLVIYHTSADGSLEAERVQSPAPAPTKK